MVGFEVRLVGGIGGVNFENTYLSWVVGTLHRKQADNARLALNAQTVNLIGKFKMLSKILRINLDFGNADNHFATRHIGRRFFIGESEQKFSVFVQKHLPKRRKVRLFGKVFFHTLKSGSKHLRGYVRIVGTIENMVGSGDSEHHTYHLGRMSAGKVVIERGKISIPIDSAHYA